MSLINIDFVRIQRIAVLALASIALTGCGGGLQDYGGLSRSLSGDIGNSYGNSIGNRPGAGNGVQTVASGRGTYPMIETSFQLASVPGDPFDYEKVNVQVTLKKPDGATVDIPAFFDGGTTWRMRFTPNVPGQFTVTSVHLNKEIAHEEKLEKKDWNVSGSSQPGFVRIESGNHARFVFDSGEHYFPMGHNQAWHTDKQPEIPELFGKMHQAGENWSRVWMTHWDGKNLDWPSTGKSNTDKSAKLGEIDLAAARKWDAIVEGAQKNGIYFQMTLQHHGQYSSKDGYKFSGNVNPNWQDNPYNAKNGGFLQSPESFFTNAQARALTKRKLYYILSRWGYSPNIMSFELFNEVEGTDAAHGKLWDDIALWHREMALFFRQYDGYRHLITTSSAPAVPIDSPIWETVDYIQTHAYVSDVATALGPTEAYTIKGKKLDKPIFFGEFGLQGLTDPEGHGLHDGLWASLMRGEGGTAQYWDWDGVEKNDLYSNYRSAASFITASSLTTHENLVSMNLPVQTSQRADLSFAPGGGWGDASQNEFVVGTAGAPSGIDKFPAFLQGTSHRNMMPKPLTLQVSYPQPGKFSVTIGQVSKGGAHLKVSVDGKAVDRDFAPGAGDYQPKGEASTVQAEVPQGAHTVIIENTGADWATVRQMTLGNYGSALTAQARTGKDYAVAWLYNRANIDAPTKSQLTPASGRIVLSSLQPGRYRATWWDIEGGKSLDASDLTVTKDKESATLSTPPVNRDLALYVMKAGTPAKKAESDKKGRKSKTSAASIYAPAGSTTQQLQEQTQPTQAQSPPQTGSNGTK